MKLRIYKAPVTRRSPRGFALIVTLSLMILLVIIAVGLLTLSATSLRTTSRGAAASEARANARLALMLAIGELQRNAGLDTRVTAPADLLDAKNPPLTGIWKSWEGADHETSGQFAGRPVQPDYASKKSAASEKGRFISWLVSNGGTDMKPADAASLVKIAPFKDSISLVSTGTLADTDKRQVHVAPVIVSGRGAQAWWISGENQKARLPRPYDPTSDTAARWSVIAKSHSVADPKPFQLDTLLTNPALADKAISRSSADLMAATGTKTRAHEYFYDLSTDSVGLLTNTATGGWRKDLSLLTESWTQQPKSGLPLFRIAPGKDTQATIPTSGDPCPSGSMLYPWASYRGTGGDIPIYRHGPVTSWENMVDFAMAYNRISASSNGRATLASASVAIDDTSTGTDGISAVFKFLHRVRVLPLIARVQWVFSHSAATAPGVNGTNGLLEPRLLLTPVVTMWNPYNVEITSPAALAFNIPKPLPPALQYTINGTKNPAYNSVMSSINYTSLGGGTLRFNISQPFTLMPGETRLFSPGTAVPVADSAVIDMQPGYRNGGGHYFPVKGPAGQVLALPASSTIKADAKFDSTYNDGALIVPEGVGIYLDMSIGGRRHLVYRMIYTPEIANVVYPPKKNLADGTLAQCKTNPQPFLSTIFGARTASRTHLAAKGFVQSSPLVNYTAMGRKDEGERLIARHYGGTAHPVNSPFDYSFVAHSGAGDSLLPNFDASNRGYIITGFNKSDGLSRCVISELPVRPLVSLGELVNWDLRYENPIPPYAINLIGNSDATPLLPADAVVNSGDAGLTVNLQYDDSYCANHLLFDDWFVSSISPDPTNFGSSGRDQKTTYTDFLNGTTPLANRAYQSILEDRVAAAKGGSVKLYTANVAPATSWKTIASRLEVEGMFNVNSTSVKAWRALLGHARGQKVPYVRESRNTWDVGLSGKSEHVMSRFSVAGDSEAGTAGSSGAFPDATEFSGYRTVDDDFLDALAEKVVDEVRARGPFLSLSEFVNRQLSSGDLALAGTIQAALNKVAKTSGKNIFSKLEALSSRSAAVPANAAAAEYQFPAAAEGYSGYGLPGWTRQADILRPLAPVLTARDDTFTIRAYGDARNADGSISARAVCEAVVRRTRNYVDPADSADLATSPTKSANKAFGRRFEVVSFRWLTPGEV